MKQWTIHGVLNDAMTSKYRSGLENSCFRPRVLSRKFPESFLFTELPSWLEVNLKRNNKATFYDSPWFHADCLTNVLGRVNCSVHVNGKTKPRTQSANNLALNRGKVFPIIFLSYLYYENQSLPDAKVHLKHLSKLL